MIVIQNRRLRYGLKILIPLLLIPATVAAGAVLFEAKRALWISFAVALLSFLFFVTGFEQKKTGTRRLVVVSMMTALSVIGRFIPYFQPIAAMTILTAIYLGGEAGFLVGALSALISNFFFGQGPWTPFQMVAWGMIGLFAGILSAPLKKSRIALMAYGAFAGILYSHIMDIWTVLWYHGTLEISFYLPALMAALPYTTLYAVSNVLFLWFLAGPMGQKLERMHVKYGV